MAFSVIIVGAVGFGGVRVRVRACFFRWLLGVGVVAVCADSQRRNSSSHDDSYDSQEFKLH